LLLLLIRCMHPQRLGWKQNEKRPNLLAMRGAAALLLELSIP
jgi:hypothetical protein